MNPVRSVSRIPHVPTSVLLVVLGLCPFILPLGPKLFTGTIVVGLLALGVVWLRETWPRPGTPPASGWVLLALLVWAVASVAWSAHPDKSLGQLPSLTAVMVLAAAGLTAATRLPAAVSRRPLLIAFGCLYVFMLGVTLWQLLADMPLLRTFYAWGWQDGPAHTFILNRALTFLVLAGWPLAGAALAAAPNRRRAWAPVFLVLAMAPTLVWTLWLGDSSAAAAAMILSSGAAALAWILPARRVAWVLGGLVLLVVFASPWLLYSVFLWVSPGLDLLPENAEARLEIVALFAEPIMARPLLGWGLYTSTRVPATTLSPDVFQVIDPAQFSVHPHNNPMQIWVDLGLVGVCLVAVLGLLAVRWIVRQPDRAWRAAGAGTLMSVSTVGLSAYGVWQVDWQAQILFATLLFLLLTPPGSSRPEEKTGPPPDSGNPDPKGKRAGDRTRPVGASVMIGAWPLLWRFVRRMGRRAWPWMVLGVVAMGLVAGASGLTAWLMKPAIDNVLAEGDRTMMWVVGLGLPAAFALKGVANYVQRAAMIRAGLGMVAVARKALFAHLLTLDAGFHGRHSAGELTSRLIVDMDTLRTVISGSVTSMGRDLATLVGLLVLLLSMDWELTLIGGLVFPLLVYPVTRLGRAVRDHTTDLQETMGRYDAALHQAFEGVRVVKVFGTPERESTRMKGMTHRLFEAMNRTEAARAGVGLMVESVTGLAVVAVVLFGGHRVIAGESTAGTFFAFVTALVLAYRPIKKLGHLNATLQEGVAVLVRLFTILDTPPALTDRPDAVALPPVTGEIRVENVTLRHEGAGAAALNGVTLRVPAGRTVALVGPSGAGKTTLLNLIARQLDPDAGQVLIDGTDIQAVTRESLWRSMALVTQNPTLFDGTVLENILYGAPDTDPSDTSPAARARAEEAARAAEADGFIRELPQGYDTPVGEAGNRLSGGQRQRLAIARAVIKNAPILLLDEATASLDRETERRVQVALDRLGSGRTVVVVAHRLATIRNAHLIHVLDQGRVVESGSHEALLATGGLYAQLWAHQGEPADDAKPTKGG